MIGKDNIRQSYDAICEALRYAGATKPGKSMICPFHEDKTPSGGLYQDEHGIWRFKCHAASCNFLGDVFDIKARAMNTPVENLLREASGNDERRIVRKAPPEKPARVHASMEDFQEAYKNAVRLYRNPNPDTGVIDSLKLRLEFPDHKSFICARIIEGGMVEEKAPPKPWPLYNRKVIRENEEIFLVEGEKAMEAVHLAGFAATCCYGGGRKGSARDADLTPLAEKTIFLWPDHDPIDDKGERGGHNHMKEAAEILKELGCRLFWIDPAKLGLGDKDDAFDYLKQFPKEKRAEAMSDVMDIAEPMGASASVRQYIEDAISGKRVAYPFPFKAITALTRALQPGTVTMLCGEAGSTKSMLMMQCFAYWSQKGIKYAGYLLEDDLNMHLTRMMAQESGNPEITDAEWCRKNPDEARKIVKSMEMMLDLVGKHCSDAPEEVLHFADILKWMDNRCRAGAKIIVIDPVTAVEAGDKPWQSEKKFMADAKVILRRNMAAMAIVTHPKSGLKMGNLLDRMSGSTAYPRFSQTVLWCRRDDKNPWRSIKRYDGMIDTMQADRFIDLVKVRNGKGQGLTLAYSFNKKNLKFDELGIDEGKDKEPVS